MSNRDSHERCHWDGQSRVNIEQCSCLGKRLYQYLKSLTKFQHLSHLWYFIELMIMIKWSRKVIIRKFIRKVPVRIS